MAPPWAGAEWVDVSPTPPDPATPGNPQPQADRSSPPDPRPPLASVKLVRPRPRPDGRDRCGRSSLTPGRGGTKHGPREERPAIQSRQPDGTASHRANSPRPL